MHARALPTTLLAQASLPFIAACGAMMASASKGKSFIVSEWGNGEKLKARADAEQRSYKCNVHLSVSQ